MTSLPQRLRPRLTQPVRSASASALRLAGHAVWRTLHPSLRERFLDGPRSAPLARIHVEAPDGWILPVFRVPARPNARGEPVLLLHTAASAAEALHYGEHSLARSLSDAGYAVFLAAQRGDPEAIAPDGGVARLTDVVRHDLPPMLAALLDDTGARRAHIVGFGLGALLAMDLGARCPDEVASVTALAPPLRWPDWRSEARRLHLAARLAPPSWSLPLRTAQRLGAPLMAEGSRLRGAMAYTGTDLPLSIVAEMARWLSEGRVELEEGRELEASLRRATAPLHVLRGADDAVCGPTAPATAQAAWGGPTTLHEVRGYGHVDLVFHPAAAVDVFTPCVEWLARHRDASWGDVEDVA